MGPADLHRPKVAPRAGTAVAGAIALVMGCVNACVQNDGEVLTRLAGRYEAADASSCEIGDVCDCPDGGCNLHCRSDCTMHCGDTTCTADCTDAICMLVCSDGKVRSMLCGGADCHGTCAW